MSQESMLNVEDDQDNASVGEEIGRMEGVDVDSNDEGASYSHVMSQSCLVIMVELDPKNLTSVVTLLHRVTSKTDRALTKIFREHTFVGIVDDTSSVIQHQTKLYLVNHAATIELLMYQTILHQFGSLATIPLHNSLPITELALCALNNPSNGFLDEDGPHDVHANEIAKLLTEKGPMLAEYFGLHIDIEILLNHEPPLHALPEFILRLYEINWEDEEECFHGVTTTLAKWYSDTVFPEDVTKARHVVEHVLFPACKANSFVAPHRLNDAVTPIACLNNLYKIFERC
ncbi:hypothetical protein DYB32_003482 [Aphanomyces invadans]|uniref:DNA mismatch repair protein Mlh1 C-terminal domain-containing protein n=1 Tax=Aphanomyces invadans TaxID=157072 RepID=A0A418B0F3_9STRA|nr:hypothetical protein DYB32_003482 [Aphanomyces invadans]